MRARAARLTGPGRIRCRWNEDPRTARASSGHPQHLYLARRARVLLGRYEVSCLLLSHPRSSRFPPRLKGEVFKTATGNQGIGSFFLQQFLIPSLQPLMGFLRRPGWGGGLALGFTCRNSWFISAEVLRLKEGERLSNEV